MGCFGRVFCLRGRMVVLPLPPMGHGDMIMKAFVDEAFNVHHRLTTSPGGGEILRRQRAYPSQGRSLRWLLGPLLLSAFFALDCRALPGALKDVAMCQSDVDCPRRSRCAAGACLAPLGQPAPDGQRQERPADLVEPAPRSEPTASDVSGRERPDERRSQQAVDPPP